MEYKSEAKYLRVSPRKLREVADVVRDQPLEKMLISLETIQKRAAQHLLKALKSAVANVENKEKQPENLKLKLLEINKGPVFKRWRPVSRGAAHPYTRKTSHIRIILTDDQNSKSQAPNSKQIPMTKSQVPNQ